MTRPLRFARFFPAFLVLGMAGCGGPDAAELTTPRAAPLPR